MRNLSSRKKKTSFLNLRIDSEINRQFDVICEEKGWIKSKQVELMIHDWLIKCGPKNPKKLVALGLDHREDDEVDQPDYEPEVTASENKKTGWTLQAIVDPEKKRSNVGKARRPRRHGS